MRSDDLVFSMGCLRPFDGNVRLVELEPAGFGVICRKLSRALIGTLLLLPKGYATPGHPCAPDPAVSSAQVRSLPKEECRSFLKAVG